MKNRKCKIVSVILAFILCASLFSGCAKSGSSSSTPVASSSSPQSSSAVDQDIPDYIDRSKINTELSGKFTFWCMTELEKDGSSDFQYYYPNIEIEWLMVPNLAEKLQSTIAAGSDLPTMVLLENSVRAQFLAYDLWENLEAEPYNLDRSELLDYVVPLLENERGEISCLQWDMTMVGFLYRRDLAQQYFGISEPEDMEARFKDFDDVLEGAKELNEKSNGEVKIFAGSDDAYKWLSAKFTDPLVSDGKTNFNAAYLDMFKTIEDLTANNCLGMDEQFSPAWYTSFANGKTMFWPCPPWMVAGSLKPNDPDGNDKYGLMSAPGGATSWGGSSAAIVKDAPEEEKLLAWTWLKWFTTTEEGARSFSSYQSVPTCAAVAEGADFYSNADPYFAGQDIMNKYLSMTVDKIRPLTIYDDMVDGSVKTGLRAIDQGESAQSAYDKMMADFKTKAPDVDTGT